MANKIAFKSYCWSIGTTSYRTDKFNMSIELQMKLLKEFRERPENVGVLWTGNNEFQAEYYEFLRTKGFVKGDAPRPDKDAREKTSGLRDIGLLDDERNVTAAGRALIKIAEREDFAADNLLEIPRDSYLYLKQLLKTSNDVDGKTVRPFVVFLYVVSKVEYLTYEEFTYLLPLCIDRETTGGGEADIVWKYEKTEAYPQHTLLIEATLADGSNQRRMEMEPVSRHLGDYCISHPLEEAYCVFITTYLNVNVISDFRARRYMEYYNTAGTDYITGMKILPVQISELKTLLRFDVKYPQIYKMLDKAHNSSEAPKEWYENNIVRETGFYNG